MQRRENHIIKGMQRDLSISKSSPEFSFENMNIRITSRDSNTLLSVTNERGNKRLSDLDGIKGNLIGYCILNNFIVLFTLQSSVSYIYRIEYISNKFYKKELYSGGLMFNELYPIETLGIFENNQIQKVYWVDGINQPRVINITATDNDISKYTTDSFDFIRKIRLQEIVNIKKEPISGGLLNAGVIQYCFTYYNKYAQESNIFYTSPLHYISPNNRGASPEEKVGNNFSIDIYALDMSFDYVRVYSIQRTSINSTPIVKRVIDLSITSSGAVNYTDNGTIGDIVDPTLLLYIGGEKIIANTITQKDNTLFLGDITLSRKVLPKSVKTFFNNQLLVFSNGNGDYLPSPSPTGLYPYINNLNLPSNRIKTFKYLETYRLGVQFQHNTGKWSEAIWINDIQNNARIGTSYVSQSSNTLPSVTLSFNRASVSEALLNGYISIRPIIVYPTLSDRSCICQGVLCPTVFNTSDRFGNSPFVQSSWFTRPQLPYDIDISSDDWVSRGTTLSPLESRGRIISNDRVNVPNIRYDVVNYGAWTEFRHNYPLPSSDKRNAEIQSMYNAPSIMIENNTGDKTPAAEYVSNNMENYYVDQSIVTLHSPDIEFDSNIKNIDTSSLKLRIVGLVPLTSSSGDIDIQTSTPANNFTGSKDIAQGFYKEPIGSSNISRYGCKGLLSGAFWLDEISDPIDNSNPSKKVTGFMVYPWHRNGSLNNTKSATDGYKSAMLDKKKISNIRYSYNNYYLSTDKIWNAYISGSDNNTGISGISIFDSNEITLVKVPSPKYSGLPDINYYGNIDKVITTSRTGDKKDGYPIMVTGTLDSTNSQHSLFVGDIKKLTGSTISNTGTDPIRMKYKSTPHAVLALNYTTSSYQKILPTFLDGNKNGTSVWPVSRINYSTAGCPFWVTDTKNFNGVAQEVLSLNITDNNSTNGYGPEYGFLWLGELYNDNVVNRFGGDGNKEEVIENNQWLPCGKTVSLTNNVITLKWEEGDTYYQRYDHIKTYPFTLEDQNAVTDIISFMCETRINIDGRYDKNRGLASNLAVTPTNFNLLNEVYSQQDNFFTYRAINSNKITLDRFPNLITWTKTKSLGELTDTWTNITLASSLDLDGDKGNVRSLNRFNNEIIAFQDTGISNILFNSRTQLATTEGVPIEIANSGKVDGKRYITDKIGCINKWSIAESPNGLYFIDNLTNGLYKLDNKITPLSDLLGFRQWIGENSSTDIWNPLEFNNFISHYDKLNNDVYFVNKTHCLCYSELINQFTSFMSYENTPAMFNFKDKFLSFKNSSMWEQNTGEYNIFYNKYKPYYVLFSSNRDGGTDKIFDTIEFRSDLWDTNNTLINKTFDTLEIWNEYQHGKCTLFDMQGRPSRLKNKFRIWRAQFPRSSFNNRDRIRNPWVYIKLEMSTENTYRMELHDITVNYFG